MSARRFAILSSSCSYSWNSGNISTRVSELFEKHGIRIPGARKCRVQLFRPGPHTFSIKSEAATAECLCCPRAEGNHS